MNETLDPWKNPQMTIPNIILSVAKLPMVMTPRLVLTQIVEEHSRIWQNYDDSYSWDILDSSAFGITMIHIYYMFTYIIAYHMLVGKWCPIKITMVDHDCPPSNGRINMDKHGYTWVNPIARWATHMVTAMGQRGWWCENDGCHDGRAGFCIACFHHLFLTHW